MKHAVYIGDYSNAPGKYFHNRDILIKFICPEVLTKLNVKKSDFNGYGRLKTTLGDPWCYLRMLIVEIGGTHINWQETPLKRAKQELQEISNKWRPQQSIFKDTILQHNLSEVDLLYSFCPICGHKILEEMQRELLPTMFAMNGIQGLNDIFEMWGFIKYEDWRQK